MTKFIARQEFGTVTALDLLRYLKVLQKNGTDLPTMYVVTSDDGDFQAVTIRENVLTDGSATHDLYLSH